MAEKKGKIQDLKLDPRNANKHSPYGTGLLENSIRDHGFGRSIVVSSDNVIIAGNGTVEGAAAIGMEKTRMVETDGTELIVVKRTDIKSGTDSFYKLALADNVVATKNIVMDLEVVEAIAEEYPSTKVWAAIVTDPPGTKDRSQNEDSDTVTMTFRFKGSQAAKVKQALKISKELNQAKMQKAENDNENANALVFIVAEYIKAHK